MLYEYLAVVTDVIDDVTLDVQIDLGFGVYSAQRVTLLERPEAENAAELMRRLLLADGPRPIRLSTTKAEADYYAVVLLSGGVELVEALRANA